MVKREWARGAAAWRRRARAVSVRGEEGVRRWWVRMWEKRAVVKTYLAKKNVRIVNYEPVTGTY